MSTLLVTWYQLTCRDVNKARGVKVKEKVKAENAKVNFRVNAAVNLVFEF